MVSVVLVHIAFWILILLSIRNLLVYRFRVDLLDKIYDEGEKDIHEGRTWAWRYQYFNRVSYPEMVFKFWKPFRSFYPDKSFVEPGKRKRS